MLRHDKSNIASRVDCKHTIPLLTLYKTTFGGQTQFNFTGRSFFYQKPFEVSIKEHKLGCKFSLSVNWVPTFGEVISSSSKWFWQHYVCFSWCWASSNTFHMCKILKAIWKIWKPYREYRSLEISLFSWENHCKRCTKSLLRLSWRVELHSRRRLDQHFSYFWMNQKMWKQCSSHHIALTNRTFMILSIVRSVY